MEPSKGKKHIIPAEKAAGINDFLESLSSQLSVPRSQAFKEQRCVTCGKEATAFENDISRKEYSLSGMCQICQNDFFKS